MLTRIGLVFRTVLLFLFFYAREADAANTVRVEQLQPEWMPTLAEDEANAKVVLPTPDSDSDSPAPDSSKSKPKVHPISLPASVSQSESVLTAALAWEHKRDTQLMHHNTKVKGHDPAKVRVSAQLCGVLAGEVKANGCSLVTYLSGAPEGCECTVPGGSCPGPPSGFTGVTPSTPFTVGSATVVLCMYWQWSDNTGPGKAADAAALRGRSVENAQNYVKAAWAYSSGEQ